MLAPDGVPGADDTRAPPPQLLSRHVSAFCHHGFWCSSGAEDRMRLTHPKYALAVAFILLSSAA
jgi:hypothetical protein